MEAFINKFYFTSVALMAIQFVHANFTEQYSGYVYFVTTATALAHHRQAGLVGKTSEQFYPVLPWVIG